jgi:hypothetical protein
LILGSLLSNTAIESLCDVTALLNFSEIFGSIVIRGSLSGGNFRGNEALVILAFLLTDFSLLDISAPLQSAVFIKMPRQAGEGFPLFGSRA